MIPRILSLLLFIFLILTSFTYAKEVEFHVSVPPRYYHSYEEIPLDVSIINYGQTSKNMTLIIEVGPRKFRYDYFEVRPTQHIKELVLLPQQMPGRQIVKGRLYYDDELKNPVSDMVPENIEILFPNEIKAYPKEVIITRFDIPDNIHGGNSYIITANIVNEGDFESDLLVELGSNSDFQSQELRLKPGEEKSINLNVTFYSTGVTFLESRIFKMEEGRKYLVNYFAKEAIITHEKIADLRFEELELYLESDQEINQNDEVKLKFKIVNKGKFPAYNVFGLISTNVPGLTIVKDIVDYGTISAGLVSGGKTAEDYFEIKSVNAPVINSTFELVLNYDDNQERIKKFTIPFTIFEGDGMCFSSWDCKTGFFCNSDKECQELICDCGEKTEHMCLNPTNSKCPSNKMCSTEGFCVDVPCECGEVYNHQCILPDNTKCPSNQRCDVDGSKCLDIHCLGGQIENHECDYKCKRDSDCASTDFCNSFNRCEPIPCGCGEIRNRQCVAYGCCNDFECGEFESCSKTINQCVPKTGCIQHTISGDSDDKIDILFIGAEYNSYEEFNDKISGLLNNHGLFSVEPFKSHKDRFNIWVILAPDFKYEYTGGTWFGKPEYAPSEGGQRFVSSCPYVDFPVVVSKDANYRSHAYFHGTAFLSLNSYSEKIQGRLLLHEFGHSFGLLRDEYVEEGKSKSPGTPNCAGSLSDAQSWWGDLATKYSSISYYEGCAYTDDNYRPTMNSIMRNHAELSTDFEPVNERALLERIQELSSGEVIRSRTESESEGASYSTQHPIIFVHGLRGSPDSFSELQNKFNIDGISKNMGFITTRTTSSTLCPNKDWDKSISVSFGYYSGKHLISENAGIEEYGKRLSKAVDLVKHCTNSEEVIIIAHSMGGLVARSYINLEGTGSVNKLITLATPHYGSPIADDWVPKYLGRDIKEMQTNSDFLKKLNAHSCDERELIVPISTKTLADRDNVFEVSDDCFKTIKLGDVFVPTESGSLLGTGKEPYVVNCAHMAPEFFKDNLGVLVGGIRESEPPITDPFGCYDAYKVILGELR